MSEQQTMLYEMTDGLFGGLGSGATMAGDWPRIEELGLADLLVSEAHGGFDGTWQDAVTVFRQAGYHALALPVPEAILAASVGAPLGFRGRGTIAASSTGELAGERFTGTLHGVVAAAGAAFVVAPAQVGGSLLIALDDGTVSAGATISGDPRDVVELRDGKAVRTDRSIFELAAFARAAQIAGALDAALALSTAYVNERKQFGRTLAKFQAIQQYLATFASEAAAANCAAMAAAQALDRQGGSFEIAAAKLRCNQAVGVGTSIAHQVHGAIGFTQEYSLHPFTRRLWAWRSEYGNDSHWAAYLGSRVCARGADNFWPDLTALTDPVSG